jgi:hypothetical protein
MKILFDNLSRFFQNVHERLDTVILICDPQCLRKREKFKFLRHGKHIFCPLYNTKCIMLLIELFIVPFFVLAISFLTR